MDRRKDGRADGHGGQGGRTVVLAPLAADGRMERWCSLRSLWTDGRTDGRIWMDGPGRIGGWTYMYTENGRTAGRTDRRKDGWTDGRRAGWTDGMVVLVLLAVDGRMDGWADGRRMDGRLDGQSLTEDRVDGWVERRVDGRMERWCSLRSLRADDRMGGSLGRPRLLI